MGIEVECVVECYEVDGKEVGIRGDRPKLRVMEDEDLDNARDADAKRAKRKPPGHPQLYVQAPLPDWMRDRSLLPKRPPTRTGRP
jgi:hypothetical protein